MSKQTNKQNSFQGSSHENITNFIFSFLNFQLTTATDPAIEVYTNKRMLVGVYLDKGRISDTPESAVTVISETPQRHLIDINKLMNNKHV